jgi:hypothetical protein
MAARENALDVISELVGRGRNFEQIVKAIRKMDRPGRGLSTAVLFNLYDEVIQARIAATILAQEGEVPPEQLPGEPSLPDTYQYVVVASITCPDGSSDTYPIVINSPEAMTRYEIMNEAISLFNGLIAQKYQRLAKWDVNNRTGKECTTTYTITEAWRKLGSE